MKFNAWGSGIGLSISKMIVENLGGKISVSSEEGSWTEFMFTVKILNDIQSNRYEESKEIRILKHVSFYILVLIPLLFLLNNFKMDYLL